MGKMIKKAVNYTKKLAKDPLGTIGGNVAKFTGMGSIAGASENAALMAAQDAERQRIQFEAQAKAMADQQRAQSDLANQNINDNIVKVEQGVNDSSSGLDLGLGTLTSKKKKGNTLSTSLGL